MQWKYVLFISMSCLMSLQMYIYLCIFYSIHYILLIHSLAYIVRTCVCVHWEHTFQCKRLPYILGNNMLCLCDDVADSVLSLSATQWPQYVYAKAMLHVRNTHSFVFFSAVSMAVWYVCFFFFQVNLISSLIFYTNHKFLSTLSSTMGVTASKQ